MLDLKQIRQNPERVKAAIEVKGEKDVDLDRLLQLDTAWRANLQELEQLRAERNRVSEEIGQQRRAGKDATGLISAMQKAGEQIKSLTEQVRQQEEELQQMLLLVPNLPHADVPLGQDEEDNVEVRRWGEIRQFSFTPLAHWDIGTNLGLLDFNRASRISGSRFTVFWADGARLVRALVTFMLDLHVGQHGYEEVYPPLLVHRDSMTGTGQLPKFEEDAFRVAQHDLFLIPTAEVPVTNLFRDEILDGDELPLALVAYTPCFRAEAGAAGRDTRGLIRQHQFDKVELVQFVRPEDSDTALEQLTGHAEKVLQLLGLPYRVTLMCTGDLGFAAHKKYDLELWMPSYDRYVEVSSCSNFTDFQARRAGIRFRPEPGKPASFVHTLNGSGLAVGRTLAAILENYQEEDGRVRLPEVLQPYMGGQQWLDFRSQA